ncbi:MAG: J domain-containing protein [Spirochaetales bacterium]|nr:J domain-containing protein [Spirochaetales bacterium]
MKDFYAVLGVHPDATTKEIKSAFRRWAKVRHPDTGGDDAEEMRIILEAYRVLSDPRTRREYDRGRLRIIPNGDDGAFDYRIWLKERLDEPEYVAKLVFYDLLHNLEDEALELYEKIRDSDEGRLERFFERPEAMDAEFCIAEEYASRGRFVDAYRVMVKLIAMEQRSPGFGYFYDVVLARFRRLVLEDLYRVLEAESMLEKLDEALQIRSSADNDAQFQRRRGEILYRLGRTSEARAALAKAAALSPRLPGLKALSLKLASNAGGVGVS